MDKTKAKSLVGIYASSATMLSILIPVCVIADIIGAFPKVPIPFIQMLVSIPSLLAIVSSIAVSKMAHKVYKRTSVLFGTALYIVGGILPYFFHTNFAVLMITAICVGLAMGIVQNGIGALIMDCFEGDARGAWLGLVSCFVGIGGVLFMSTAAKFGAVAWYRVYLSYLLIVPMFILELICLPKGKLEAKPTKTNRVKVPKEVIIICIFGFITFTCTQIFNNDISILVTGRGFGGTIQSGQATSIHTMAGMIAGLLVLPYKKLTKRLCLPIAMIAVAAGCIVIAVSPAFGTVLLGTVMISMAYAVYNPLQTQLAAEACDPMGMAFNLALLNAAGSLGNALSPLTLKACTSFLGDSATVRFAFGGGTMAVLMVIAFIYFGRTAKKQEN